RSFGGGGLKPRNAQATVAPVRTTVPSTSSGSRGTSSRASVSSTRSWLRQTSGRNVSCVKRRSQLLTVRAVGTRGRPAKRRTRGSPTRTLKAPARAGAGEGEPREQRGDPPPAVVTAERGARGLQSAG